MQQYDNNTVERHGEDEQAAPTELFSQYSTDKGSQQEAEIDSAHVDAQDFASIFRRVDGKQDRQAGTENHGRAGPLENTKKDQLGAGGGKSGENRPDSKDPDPNTKNPFSAVNVGKSSERHEQRRSRQKVGSGDPAQNDSVHGKLFADKRQGDID